MAIRDKVTINGKDYLVLREGMTKVVAQRALSWQRKMSPRAIIRKVSRGNYRLLV